MARPIQTFDPGERFGARVVLEYLGRLHRSPSVKEQRYRVRCDCGLTQEVWRSQLLSAGRCIECSWEAKRAPDGFGRVEHHLAHAERPDVCALLAEAGEAWPGLWRADDSDEGELAVASLEAYRELASVGPFTLAEIGLLLGLSRERIRQIEEAALRRVRVRIAKHIGAARVLADYEGHEERGAGVWELLGLQGAGGKEAA